MKRIHTISIQVAFCTTLFSIIGFISEVKAQPFTTKLGLFDQTKPNDLGLTAANGTETVTVFKATTSSDHYANGVAMVGFKGYLYCQWQSSATNEDSPDTWVAYSRSQNGTSWAAPMKLAVPFNSSYCTSGGWWVNGDTLVAFVNVWPTTLTPRGGFAYYTKSTDGITWTALKQVRMSDGSVMVGIIEQDPHALSSGRIINAAHFQPGLLACPIYTDDVAGYRGWKKGTYTPLAYTGDVTREIEPSWFWQRDGSAVMIFRDQTSTFYKLASKSTNNGQTWSTTVLTDMPDSRAKQSAGNLPDGTAYMVHNPVTNKNRYPLAIVLSQDGALFDRAFVLRKGGSDLQAQQYTGTAKTLGYSYPKSMVWNDYIYAAYSTNKEDVEFTRIPLSSLGMGSQCVFGVSDKCDRCTGSMTGLTACSAVGEAETDACTYEGAVESSNLGFKGTGYINVPNAIGSKITFNINATSAGAKTLSFRYASSGTADRPASIVLNGTALSNQLKFPATGAFTTYKTVEISLTFNSGANTLQLIATTADGLANIDQIGYVSAGISKGSCVVTGLEDNENRTSSLLFPNPFSSSFQITYKGLLEFFIYDLTGSLIDEGKAINELTLGNNLRKGLYIVKIKTEYGLNLYKITKN
jgi:hypothetical protein